MKTLVFKSISGFAKTAQKKSNKKKSELLYNPFQAMRLVRCFQLANFDESVYAKVELNVDPRHGDQIVRGTVRVPHSLGLNKKLAVLTTNNELRAQCLESTYYI